MSARAVVAIDGPAGSGKSTVARRLAAALGVPHVDTGAYYRAATLALLRAGIDPSEEKAADVVAGVSIARPGGRTHLDGEDVEDEIRGPEVTAAVSAVAAQRPIRDLLVPLQRAAVGSAGAVVEGRDAGTVVVADACLKVWLDAPAGERGRRRAHERGETSPDQVAEHVADVVRRDQSDAAQMARAADVVVVHTGGRSIDDVVARVVELLRERLP